MSANKCIYPGSFDPVTKGHLDIIARTTALFDEVLVAVLYNPDKKGCFSMTQRVEMLRAVCAPYPNVRVTAYGGLLAELARETGIHAVVRGVRGMADFESETTMARINRQLNPGLETLLLPADPAKEAVSASAVRQLAAFGADLSAYVPEEILPKVRAAFAKKGEG